MQVVMSFHQCGGNTGDSCYIPLPPWVLDIGELNPDIFFTNRDRMRNREYLSFSIDERPELDGRSAIQVRNFHLSTLLRLLIELGYLRPLMQQNAVC